MKLKTLKDLKEISEFDRNKFSVRNGFNKLIFVDDLRQEAIKQIKAIDKEIKKDDNATLNVALEITKDWIKYFFNIKEKLNVEENDGKPINKKRAK